MSWLDAPELGPLGAAARALAPDLSKGPEGLRTLLSLIEAHLDADADEAAERAFVEGAGAALGALLIAHVGDGAHVERDGAHRIRVGRFGFFDPFGAVEAVLDADDPRVALAAAVRHAESEAKGEGPLSRVVTRLSDALADRTPPLMVREHFERYVKLSDETELDLTRVVEATAEGTTSDVARSVEKLISFVGGRDRVVPWDDAKARLLPRLVATSFEASLPDEAGDRGELAIEPRFGGLRIALILGYEGRSRFVRVDELERWERGFDRALEVAIENLAERSVHARFARVETDAGPLVVARSGDGLDAARLLLPGLHEVLASELGSPFFASVPHRDTLLASPAEPEAIVAALRHKTTDDAARAPHRISDALFVVSPEGLSDARES